MTGVQTCALPISVTHANPLAGRFKNGTIGLPVPNTDIKIVSLETGEPVGINETGELCIKGPQVMQGYYKRDEENSAPFATGGCIPGILH